MVRERSAGAWSERSVATAAPVIADEPVPRRHLHGRQGGGIKGRGQGNHLVRGEEVGGDRVRLVRRERPRRVQRHGATHIVEDRGRIRPIVPNGVLERRVLSETEPSSGGVAPNQRWISGRLAFPARTVARRAFLRV